MKSRYSILSTTKGNDHIENDHIELKRPIAAENVDFVEKKGTKNNNFEEEKLEWQQDIGLPSCSGYIESQAAPSQFRWCSKKKDAKLNPAHQRNFADIQLWSSNLHPYDKQNFPQSLKGKEPNVREEKNGYQGVYRKFTFKREKSNFHRQDDCLEIEDTDNNRKTSDFTPQINKGPKLKPPESNQRSYGRSAEIDDDLIARRRRSTRKSEVFEHSDLFKKERIKARVICKRFGRTNSLL